MDDLEHLPHELGLHGLCAIGVLLGRIARINTWDTVTEPTGTLTRTLDTLTLRASPVAVVILFGVIWLGHAVTRALATTAGAWVSGHLPAKLSPPPPA